MNTGTLIWSAYLGSVSVENTTSTTDVTTSASLVSSVEPILSECL